MSEARATGEEADRGEGSIRRWHSAVAVGAVPVIAQGPGAFIAATVVVLLVLAVLFVWLRRERDEQIEEEEKPEIEEAERPTDDLLEERDEFDEAADDYEEMSLAEVKKAKMARVEEGDRRRETAGEATERVREEHADRREGEELPEGETERVEGEEPDARGRGPETSETEGETERESVEEAPGTVEPEEEEGEAAAEEERVEGTDREDSDARTEDVGREDADTEESSAEEDNSRGIGIPSPGEVGEESRAEAGQEEAAAGEAGDEKSLPTPSSFVEDEEPEADESETEERDEEAGEEGAGEEPAGAVSSGEESAGEEVRERDGTDDDIPEDIHDVEAEPKSFEKGLEKTREGFIDRLSSLFSGEQLSDEMVEEVEEVLFSADIGPRVAQDILDAIEEQLSGEELEDPGKVWGFIRHYTRELLETHEEPLDPAESDAPFVVLVVGVNGVGKTTTIGKMASRFERDGHSVLLVAGDTFRAAAVEQLGIWADRTDLPMHSGEEGADPASVIYSGIERAVDEDIDVVLCDTSGRLHTDVNLMDELEKMERVAGNANEGSPQEVHLVLDANTGQNAIQQAEKFHETLDVTGITLTKFDGTARGGVILGVCKRFDAPIRYVGIGERIVDLREFDAGEFVEALFM